MTNETWKPIPGYEGRYEASDLGRVRSVAFMQRYLLRTGVEAYRRTAVRVRRHKVNNGGYHCVDLWLDDKAKGFTVHRLVATVFVPNPDNLPEVNHKNGIKADCRAENLEWVTCTGNKLHAVAIGLNPTARRVVAPSGNEYPSIAQAAKGERVAHRTVAKWSRA